MEIHHVKTKHNKVAIQTVITTKGSSVLASGNFKNFLARSSHLPVRLRMQTGIMATQLMHMTILHRGGRTYAVFTRRYAA